MITANNTKKELTTLLKKEGFDFNNPNCKLALEVFKKFIDIKVDCTNDDILFQCGVYGFTGEELYSVEFVRQFTFEVDEEYDHMEQLMLTIYFKPNDELQKLEKNLWASNCGSVDDFFKQVENLPEYKIPTEKYIPFKSRVELDLV